MRKILQACVLALALSASAYAGDMQFPVTAPPPQQSATNGEIQTGAADSLTDAVLNLLGSVLALF